MNDQTDPAQSWGSLLRANQEEVLERWMAAAAAGLAGRMTGPSRA